LCRVVSDMKILVEKVPEAVEVSGHVDSLVQRASDVVEVCVRPSQRMPYFAGQYFSVQFRGFPARCYSPTVPLDWPSDARPLRFHVRQLPGGRVSSALGRKIVGAHRVTLTGPFGSAYLRAGHVGRLVLVAGGTGFAPIWAIAEAAIRERPQRELVLIVGARSLDSLYMIPALCRLALFPSVTIVPVVSERQSMTHAVHEGRPTDYIPALSPTDLVYTAGAPAMVETAARIAKAAGARCFSDPFEPSHNGAPGFLSRAADWLVTELQSSPPLSMADWTFEDPRTEEAIPALAGAPPFRPVV
jgi:NAD(P)H-flavin reductase